MEKYDKSIDMDSVYREYEKLVYRFLYSHTHDAEWSQELMQETFLRAVNSISRYDGTCKLSVWLCQIAKHILYQELRKKKQIETVELVDYLTDDSAPNGETSILKQESKIELCFREIGEILGKSENWSRTVFYRAKQKIREELKKYE